MRRWPIQATRTLLGLTLLTAIADLFTGILAGVVGLLSAATAIAHLCQRRHSQQGLMAALVMLSALGFILAPSAPFASWWPVPFIGFGLLAGSRGVAGWLLRSRPAASGGKRLLLSGAIFGLTVIPGPWWRAGTRWTGTEPSTWLAALAMFVAGTFTLLAVTPLSVKTILETQEDYRPAVALWMVMTLWVAVRTATGHH